LRFGLWALGFGPNPPTPNPQSPIPNPQSPFDLFLYLQQNYYFKKTKNNYYILKK
jgi:hypothetical protein